MTLRSYQVVGPPDGAIGRPDAPADMPESEARWPTGHVFDADDAVAPWDEAIPLLLERSLIVSLDAPAAEPAPAPAPAVDSEPAPAPADDDDTPE